MTSIPQEFLDLLSDELAPFGFELEGVGPDDGERTETLTYRVEPDTFVRQHRGTGIRASYRDTWPPDSLRLVLVLDPTGDVLEASFEVFDLLAWAAGEDPDLADRMNSFTDAAECASAIAAALAGALSTSSGDADSNLW